MKLSQVEYFLAVAKELCFTTAAETLYISQPALSRQIVLMENELGVKLFNRTSRRVSLTPAGEALREDLQEVLLHLERAKRRAISIGTKDRLNLRIGCFDGVDTDDFLPLVHQRTQEMVPGVQITLIRDCFAKNRSSLQRGDIDLLLTLSVDLPGDCGEELLVRKIVSRRGALFYSEDSPLAQFGSPTPEDFARETFLSMAQAEMPELHRNGLANLSRLGISHPTILEVENYATLSAYLNMGLGYAILTETAGEKNPRLHKVNLEEDVHWVLAVWKRNHPMSAALERCFPESGL